MTLEIAAETDVGREQGHNEDTVYTGEYGQSKLLGVADGMGGHRAGDVASQEAIEAFASNVEGVPDDDRAGTLLTAVERANDHLREMVAENPEYEGMGTTLVAAIVTEDDATVVNVGDSRAYHISGEGISQVTVDHTMVQEMVEAGSLTPEEAEDHPQSNYLSQSLGPRESVDPDTFELTLTGPLLLCSDGLTDEVSDSTIHDIVTREESARQIAERLINRANEQDGTDNISVVVATYG